MTPEERKALARRQDERIGHREPGRNYPLCCEWHRGFDAALGLLVAAPMWTDGNDWHGDSPSGAPLYAIKPPSEAP